MSTLTVREAARRAGVTPSRINQLVRGRKLLVADPDNGQRKIKLHSLERYLAQRGKAEARRAKTVAQPQNPGSGYRLETVAVILGKHPRTVVRWLKEWRIPYDQTRGAVPESSVHALTDKLKERAQRWKAGEAA